MGTFMTKHCSPVSYGTPLEKKSCSAANYGSPLNQKPVDLGIVKSNYKDKPFNPPFPGKAMYEGTGDMAQFKGKYTPEMLKMNANYTYQHNKANIPGYVERKRKAAEAEASMTEEQRSRDDY